MDRTEPILVELPVELLTPRLRLVPPSPGDGLMVNRAIAESFVELHRWMDWAATMPSIIVIGTLRSRFGGPLSAPRRLADVHA